MIKRHFKRGHNMASYG